MITVAARFLYHRGWYRGSNNCPTPRRSTEQRDLGAPQRCQVTMSRADQARGHTMFTDDGHPQPPSLAATVSRERASSAKVARSSPHQSSKRKVTNQKTDFVLTRPTQGCDMEHCKSKAPNPAARHHNNRFRRVEHPSLTSLQRRSK